MDDVERGGGGSEVGQTHVRRAIFVIVEWLKKHGFYSEDIVCVWVGGQAEGYVARSTAPEDLGTQNLGRSRRKHDSHLHKNANNNKTQPLLCGAVRCGITIANAVTAFVAAPAAAGSGSADLSFLCQQCVGEPANLRPKPPYIVRRLFNSRLNSSGRVRDSQQANEFHPATCGTNKPKGM